MEMSAMGILDMFAKRSKKTSSGIGATAIGKTEVAGRTYTVHEGGVMVADPIPVHERIKGVEPGPSGLYPHELLMLSYAERYLVRGAEFQGFWWYQYGVKDPGRLLKDLVSRHYVCVGGIAQALANAKVPELKEACKTLGLRTTGKKSELIERLSEHEEELDSRGMFQDRYYALTESGRQALEEEPYVPWAHANMRPEMGLTIWTIGEKVGGGGRRRWRDYQWGEFNRAGMEQAAAGDFGLYRNTRLAMCEFLEEEGRTLDALRMAVEVECLDLGGAVNGFDANAAFSVIDGMMPYKTSSLRSAPGVVRKIKKLAKDGGMSDRELDEFVRTNADRLMASAPMRIFTAEEVARIVRLEMEGDTNKLSRLYGSARRRYLGSH